MLAKPPPAAPMLAVLLLALLAPAANAILCPHAQSDLATLAPAVSAACARLNSQVSAEQATNPGGPVTAAGVVTPGPFTATSVVATSGASKTLTAVTRTSAAGQASTSSATPRASSNASSNASSSSSTAVAGAAGTSPTQSSTGRGGTAAAAAASPSGPAPSSSSNGGSNYGLTTILPAVLCSVVGAAIILGILIFLLRRRSRRKRDGDEKVGVAGAGAAAGTAASSPHSSRDVEKSGISDRDLNGTSFLAPPSRGQPNTDSPTLPPVRSVSQDGGTWFDEAPRRSISNYSQNGMEPPMKHEDGTSSVPLAVGAGTAAAGGGGAAMLARDTGSTDTPAPPGSVMRDTRPATPTNQSRPQVVYAPPLAGSPATQTQKNSSEMSSPQVGNTPQYGSPAKPVELPAENTEKQSTGIFAAGTAIGAAALGAIGLGAAATSNSKGKKTEEPKQPASDSGGGGSWLASPVTSMIGGKSTEEKANERRESQASDQAYDAGPPTATSTTSGSWATPNEYADTDSRKDFDFGLAQGDGMNTPRAGTPPHVDAEPGDGLSTPTAEPTAFIGSGVTKETAERVMLPNSTGTVIHRKPDSSETARSSGQHPRQSANTSSLSTAAAAAALAPSFTKDTNTSRAPYNDRPTTVIGPSSSQPQPQQQAKAPSTPQSPSRKAVTTGSAAPSAALGAVRRPGNASPPPSPSAGSSGYNSPRRFSNDRLYPTTQGQQGQPPRGPPPEASSPSERRKFSFSRRFSGEGQTQSPPSSSQGGGEGSSSPYREVPEYTPRPQRPAVSNVMKRGSLRGYEMPQRPSGPVTKDSSEK